MTFRILTTINQHPTSYVIISYVYFIVNDSKTKFCPTWICGLTYLQLYCNNQNIGPARTITCRPVTADAQVQSQIIGEQSGSGRGIAPSIYLFPHIIRPILPTHSFFLRRRHILE